jgi:chemotaxis-related protein WspD
VTAERNKLASDCRNLIGVWGDNSCDELLKYVHCQNCPVFANVGRDLLTRQAPDEYLEAWEQRAAKLSDDNEVDSISVLVFRLGKEWYSIRTEFIKEVFNPLPTHAIPHRLHSCFIGLTNLRGELIPCADLGQLIGASQDHSRQDRSWPRMIATDWKSTSWVFPVDEVKGIIYPLESSLRLPPVTIEMASPNFTYRIFADEGRDIGLLDYELIEHAFRSIAQ